MYGSEKISVVIPVYNTEKYVEKSVRSVMDQTYGNIEIICVNDGSTDGSSEILAKLEAEDDRIVVIDKCNGGLGDARNRGIGESSSEWILFLDSDDTLRPDALERVSSAFASGADMIHFGINVVYEDGVGTVKSDGRYYSMAYSGLVDIDDKVISAADVSACNKVFRKSLMDRYGIRFENIQYEDFLFSMQYMLMSGKVFYIQDKLYNYLRRSGSIMSTTFCRSPRAIEHMYALDYLYRFASGHGLVGGHADLLSELFLNCYRFSIKYSTPEKFRQIADFATGLYGKYPFLQVFIDMKTKNRTVVFEKNGKSHWGTLILEHLFSLKYEFVDYYIYKVLRIFNIIVYKRLEKSC